MPPRAEGAGERVATLPPLGEKPTAALVTASYAPDFERCRLLCETVDRHVSGFSRHLILVEERDVTLFRALETPRRTVVSERDLLPAWLRPFSDPLSWGKRRIWLSPRTPPLRGWHVQQLRRIAIADHVGEDLLVFCDSDVAFTRAFDCSVFAENGRARLYRADPPLPEGLHRRWSAQAGRALGLAEPSTRDYIATLIAWRADATRAMRDHIERTTGRHWIAAVTRARQFSECLLYGRFAEEVLAGAGHAPDPRNFCHIHWTGPTPTDESFQRFLAEMKPWQSAIGIQSFMGMDPDRIRRLLGEA
ncbi:MAG: hypothetical protein INR68_03555 [Methylobacterium mesophilicum]|nr:hypothetical protein [Methylobacterium mesophilicum]